MVAQHNVFIRWLQYFDGESGVQTQLFMGKRCPMVSDAKCLSGAFGFQLNLDSKTEKVLWYSACPCGTRYQICQQRHWFFFAVEYIGEWIHPELQIGRMETTSLWSPTGKCPGKACAWSLHVRCGNMFEKWVFYKLGSFSPLR